MLAIKYSRPLTRALYVVPVLASALLLALLARIWFARVAFPMDLEWLESSSLEEAWRCFHAGTPVYGDPADGFQTQIYTPLYFAVVGLVSMVVGFDYWTGRLVSMAAMVVTFSIIGHLVAKHARNRLEGRVLGLAAVGCIAASYSVSGASMDQARPDALAVMLLVGAVATLGREPAPHRAILAATLLAGSIYTKQSYLASAPWLLFFAVWRSRKNGLLFGAAFAVATVVPFMALDLATDGWFYRWTTVAGRQHVEAGRALPALLVVLRFAPYLPLTLLGAPVAVALRRGPTTAALWWGVLVSVLLTGLSGVLKQGGGYNNLIPVLVVAPVATLLLVVEALDGRLATWRHRPRAVAAVLVALGLYLAPRCVSPLWAGDGWLVPNDAELKRANALDDFVESLQGGVLAPSHPFLGRRSDPAYEQVMMMGYAELYMALCIPRGTDKEQCALNVTTPRTREHLRSEAWGLDPDADIAEIGAEWIIAGPGDLWLLQSGRYAPWCTLKPPYAFFDFAPAALKYVYRRRHGAGDHDAFAVCKL